MNALAVIPIELRMAMLFALGVGLGAAANAAIYRLAWTPRPISPWLAPHPEAPRRSRGDRVPIFGWLGVRREAPLHGPGFWVRPMVLEVLFGLGAAALYGWEIGQAALLPPGAPGRPLQGPLPLVEMHAQLAAHLLLIWLMVVASLIDIDERIIPDSVTVPGTLLGLLAAAVYPWSLLPNTFALLPKPGVPVREFPFLTITSPEGWPAALDGRPNGWPLTLALGCWWLWCVALMHRTWYARHGWGRALGLMCARLRRAPSTPRLIGLGAIGSAIIVGVWFQGAVQWVGLFTALVGMAVGGGLIWAVRIIGAAVLRREAMGFGDVTLMAMLGAFLGWQATLIIFFLAPLAGLVVGIVMLVVRRDNEIPYGPFLCLAALGMLIAWPHVWNWLAQRVFVLGSLLPWIMLGCLAAMAVLLGLIRLAGAALATLRSR